MKRTFPEFATIGRNGTALRLVSHGKNAVYFRDAGNWDMRVAQKNGKLVCSNNSGNTSHLNGLEVFECDKNFWKKDNMSSATDKNRYLKRTAKKP